MEIFFTKQAQEDLNYFETHDKKISQRIQDLLNDIKKHPFSGIGKPEPLRYKMAGYWSRRIDRQHRIVYYVHKEQIYIAQCRYHYDK